MIREKVWLLYIVNYYSAFKKMENFMLKNQMVSYRYVSIVKKKKGNSDICYKIDEPMN